MLYIRDEYEGCTGDPAAGPADTAPVDLHPCGARGQDGGHLGAGMGMGMGMGK